MKREYEELQFEIDLFSLNLSRIITGTSTLGEVEEREPGGDGFDF